MKRTVAKIHHNGTYRIIMDDSKKYNPYNVYHEWLEDGFHQKKLAEYADIESGLHHISEVIRKGGARVGARNINENRIETFYTGGGIWITAYPLDGNHYYTVDNDFGAYLNLYEDRFEGCGGDEFPCCRMVWSKGVNQMTGDEWNIYRAMTKDLERVMNI